MLAPVQTIAPLTQPLELADVKAHLNVDHSDDDAVITALLAAAVDHLDGWTGILGRALVTQTWRQDFADFRCLRLPLAPIASISKIEYFDASGVMREVPDTIYAHRTDARGGYVELKPDQTWPGTYARTDAVSVTFVAGTDPANVPPAIKAAILLLVAHWYANREAVIGSSVSELPLGVAALLAPYRRVGV